jgi:methyl-accepting chemotaxis protein
MSEPADTTPSPAPQPEPASEPPGVSGRPQRQMRNFLLQPRMQVQLAGYLIVLSLVFTAAVLGILHSQFVRLQGQLTMLLGAGVDPVVSNVFQETVGWLVAAVLIFLIASLALSVVFTHRMVGPTYAFRRHIQALARGDLEAETKLRDQDAFQEVADDLNALSAALRERQQQS